MGLCNSPDIFQEQMLDLMDGLEFVHTYLDDLLVLTNDDYDDHIEKLHTIFQHLSDAGSCINAKNLSSKEQTRVSRLLDHMTWS